MIIAYCGNLLNEVSDARCMRLFKHEGECGMEEGSETGARGMSEGLKACPVCGSGGDHVSWCAPAPAGAGLIGELRALLAKATPGPWEDYAMPISSAQEAKTELALQVDCTRDVGTALHLLNADGLCPATTGCGPTSAANAALIVAAVNALPTLLTRLEAQQPAGEREAALREDAIAEGLCFLDQLAGEGFAHTYGNGQEADAMEICTAIGAAFGVECEPGWWRRVAALASENAGGGE